MKIVDQVRTKYNNTSFDKPNWISLFLLKQISNKNNQNSSD